MNSSTEYDYVIIGSGFGGSVSAMRLSEKGYKVLVIEKGKKLNSENVPKTDWNIPKFLWAPFIKCFGPQSLTFFKEVFILGGVGVGGGSNVYGNTHMFPSDKFFNNKAWSHLNNNWKKTLLPFYDKAKFMLGTIPFTDLHTEDMLLKEIATEMGKEDSFGGVNVGVYYGDENAEVDPYFNGLGPKRKGCIKCAGCMLGCRYNAKNTLDKNYLFFAEKFGAEILPETIATGIHYQNKEYLIDVQSSTSWFNKNKRTIKAKGLIVSAGVIGTMKLLLKEKFESKNLNKLSDQLGNAIRTNSEMLCGISNADRALNNSVAISSYFNADENTHIEVVKYNTNSGAMGRMSALATGPAKTGVRAVKLVGNILSNPYDFLRSTFKIRNWGKNSIILLVMQSLEESLKLEWKKGLFGGSIRFDPKESNAVPAYIDIGQKVLHRYAEKVKGVPLNAGSEILLNTPMTAHILGGCKMGSTPEEGVVKNTFEVHNYPNMYVLDGSIIPCNLGVNPSLTITSLSEYAMSLIPDKKGNQNIKLEDQLLAKQVKA
ncbi:GMC oxidoreductase [Flammeovirga kamogawensis]|uniref:Cholesterol oxidase n=1 Tax=Flammeovirga kamogawensis TaxID=373891 RepID=A0ABX8GWF4_9BACT|nr:GMC oxidoreductase [Flammeovirga kamogawensis]MBB6460570.1 cholesterol oxidase [Flammeovirga kamogawensis]QWG07929.1 GMC family oxidoreductase N-terminal domain-containing protein [Flammeovirga kamogawensis]TRX69736.1 GMC family oxidoreductase [Flammeovirga kamogawensis]